MSNEDTAFHEGHMAEELAEMEYHSITLPEAMELVRESLQKSWLETAQNNPAFVRLAYYNLISSKRGDSQ